MTDQSQLPPVPPRRAGSGLVAPRPEVAAEGQVEGAGRHSGDAASAAVGGVLAAPRTAAQPQVAPVQAAQVAHAQAAEARVQATAQATADARGRAEAQARAQGLPQGIGIGQATGIGAATGTAAVAGKGRGIGVLERPPEGETEDRVRTRPMTPEPRDRMFGIHAGQVVCWQVAVVGVLVGLRQTLTAAIVLIAASFVLVAVTAIRYRGRWAYSWVLLWLRYRTRRRSRAIQGGATADQRDIATALLRSLTGGGEFSSHEFADETVIGLISHPGGLSAVLEVNPRDPASFVQALQGLPPITSLLPAEPSDPMTSVQVIVQSIPAPSMLGAGDSASASYQQLAGGTIPARRSCWIAVGVTHSAGMSTAMELRETLLHAVDRLQRRLRKANLRARLLSAEEAAADLLAVAGVELSPRELAGAFTAEPRRRRRGRGGTVPRIVEHWRSWSAGSLLHTCYRLPTWPDLGEPAGRALLDSLMPAGCLASTVSIAARRGYGPDDVELETSVRVTLPGAASIDGVTEELTEAARACEASLQRLDGEQVFGVAASLPLGGFLR